MQIDQYHGTMPDWRRTTTTRAGLLFGVELEVEHPVNRQEAANALDNFEGGNYPLPAVERDGSLDPRRGVEIICPPLPMEEVRAENGYIARLMGRLRASGVTPDQRAGCGMHVNVNVVDWAPQEKVLVQWCLNAFTNVVRLVGRRRETEGDDRTFGAMNRVFFYHLDAANLGLTLSTFPGGKHSSAWLRAPAPGFPAGRGDALVLEARFPRSSLEIKDLHSAIDFITAIRDWIRAAPNHTQAGILLCETVDKPLVMEGLFLRWCHKHRPELLRQWGVRDELIDTVPKGKRLQVATRIYEETNDVTDTTGFCPRQPGCKEQVLRISTLVGKGSGLAGKPTGYGRIDPASVRARR
jgi:hypothetical protein